MPRKSKLFIISKSYKDMLEEIMLKSNLSIGEIRKVMLHGSDSKVIYLNKLVQLDDIVNELYHNYAPTAINRMLKRKRKELENKSFLRHFHEKGFENLLNLTNGI